MMSWQTTTAEVDALLGELNRLIDRASPSDPDL
jgi:hypothetical protein